MVNLWRHVITRTYSPVWAITTGTESRAVMVAQQKNKFKKGQLSTFGRHKTGYKRKAWIYCLPCSPFMSLCAALFLESHWMIYEFWGKKKYIHLLISNHTWGMTAVWHGMSSTWEHGDKEIQRSEKLPGDTGPWRISEASATWPVSNNATMAGLDQRVPRKPSNPLNTSHLFFFFLGGT